jgi:hypothetical protein
VKRAVVFGGYGTFGALVARELARLGVTVTVAGRDRRRAEALARELGPGHAGAAADVSRRESCRQSALPKSVVEAADEGGIAAGVGDVRVMATRLQASPQKGGIESLEWPGTVDRDRMSLEHVQRARYPTSKADWPVQLRRIAKGRSGCWGKR